MGFNSGFKGLMFCREVNAVCFVNHTKHPDTLCGQTGEVLRLNQVCMCSTQYTLHG